MHMHPHATHTNIIDMTQQQKPYKNVFDNKIENDCEFKHVHGWAGIAG